MSEPADPILAGTDWADAASMPLAGDASARRYRRLTRSDGARAVLMLAPADGGTARFVAVARHLRALGLSAPAILIDRAADGRLLLEDLGDATLAGVVAADPGIERPLYEAAIDLLAELHRHPAPASLTAPTAGDLGAMTEPAATWYLGAGTPQPGAAMALHETVADALAAHAPDTPVLVHRDFHAENLIWLPRRTGPARLGILDFQDAWAGHPAYDLASLTRDARRDLGAGLGAHLMARYAAITDTDPARLEAATAAIAAQRNLRILGVFARVALDQGKARYLDLMPRVWDHLQADLAHPALGAVRTAVTTHLPAPNPTLIATLKARCQTVPAQ